LEEKAAPHGLHEPAGVAPPDGIAEHVGDGLLEVAHVAARHAGELQAAHDDAPELLRGGGGGVEGVAHDVVGVLVLPVVDDGVHHALTTLVRRDVNADA
jgi:hypothetical protein